MLLLGEVWYSLFQNANYFQDSFSAKKSNKSQKNILGEIQLVLRVCLIWQESWVELLLPGLHQTPPSCLGYNMHHQMKTSRKNVNVEKNLCQIAMTLDANKLLCNHWTLFSRKSAASQGTWSLNPCSFFLPVQAIHDHSLVSLLRT